METETPRPTASPRAAALETAGDDLITLFTLQRTNWLFGMHCLCVCVFL